MLDKGLGREAKRRSLLWKWWATVISVNCLLSGCLVIPIELPPRLTQGEAPSGRQAPDTPAQSQTIAQMETRVRQRINAIRQEHGLETLQANEKLAKVARAYSREMAAKNFFSHVDPEGGNPAERVRAGGLSYRVVAENLFKSTNAAEPVPLAVKGWMTSPGHRENILREGVTETGVGVWREGNTYYITQLFMRPLFP